MDNVEEVVKNIVATQSEMMEEIAEIKKLVMDEIINPIKSEYEKMEYDNALSDFRCKYAEKLDGFTDKLKAIEGDDFDIAKQVFDDFKADSLDLSEEEYVDKVVEKVENQLESIANAFGVKPEDVESVTVEVVEDGKEVEKTVEVDNKEKPGEPEKPEKPEKPGEPEEAEEAEEGSEEYWQEIYDKEVK